MLIGKYTDDDIEFNTPLLVEILHDKGLLSDDELQQLLPLGLDIIKE